MKKLVLLIVALLLVSIMVVHAEEIDLSGMSDSEISSLYNSIIQEMLDRGITKSGDLSEGHYIVGQDIRAGSYSFSSNGGYTRYFVFKSNELFDIYEELSSVAEVMIEGETVFEDDPDKVDLKDGQILSVEYGTLHVEEIRNSLMP